MNNFREDEGKNGCRLAIISNSTIDPMKSSNYPMNSTMDPMKSTFDPINSTIPTNFIATS